MPNRLALESSPYLLQHQNNPVDWYAWCDEAWEKARRENKLVLISIGYSACHWCHVMEHESFENETTAHLMNEHYVCIKVDREERPDVDQVYMSAVQLMSGQGGWPLNCFTLPDGRPLYGGTYFPNSTWNDLLQKLSAFYRNEPERAIGYASELTNGLHQTDLFPVQSPTTPVTGAMITSAVENWKKLFDGVDGGPNRAPKFPLPNNYEFLLHYAVASGDEAIRQHVLLTLDKMAAGGIYDQLGGGFARYSVDSHWKVPHFEKMLYDNAQLISLYAKASQFTGNKHYADIVHETLAFIERELTAPEGVCYAALDADSEGVEGKYYTWTAEELDSIEFPEYPQVDTRDVFKRYFAVNTQGYWEHGRNILLRSEDEELLAVDFGITKEELNSIIAACKSRLLPLRDQRVRPGLDNKILLSWNAMMISAWCDAYDLSGNDLYLKRAESCADWLLSNMRHADGRLFHSTVCGKQAAGPSFLEDYAFLAKAMISLYRSNFDERRLQHAVTIVDYAVQHFSDHDSGSFWYTSDLDPKLISRKQEVQDNVIPASTSVMSRVLYDLGHYFGNPAWIERATTQLEKIAGAIPSYGSAYSNWLQFAMHSVSPRYEVIISGPQAKALSTEIRNHYLPTILLAGDENGKATLPLCTGRFRENDTFIHVCCEKSCQLPVRTVKEALLFLATSAPRNG